MEVDKASLEITGLHAWLLREPESHHAYSVIELTARSGAKGYGECAEVSQAEVEAARSILVGRAGHGGARRTFGAAQRSPHRCRGGHRHA